VNPNVPTTTAVVPFTVSNRVLVHQGSQRGVLSTNHLEEVRDYLRKLQDRQAPKDHDRSLDQLHVSFIGKRMSARLLRHDGIDREQLGVSDHGAHQLAREVLPSRFFTGLRELAHLDEQGEKLATMAWTKFSVHAKKPRMVRTIRMNLGTQQAPNVQRVVRSCHSQSYAPYSNLAFVSDMLEHSGEFAKMPLLDWHVSDTVMRLRFAGCEKNEIDLDTPVPMVEAWNSEVGMRRVGLRGGMWKLICTNGMGHWDERKEWNWIHRGDASRIQDGVRSAFEDLLTQAKGVVSAYQQALDVSIDDAFVWMEEEMTRGAKAPERVIQGAQKALTDSMVTPGAGLASVVDAITLIAQDENDVLQQYELERLAAQVLRRGLSQSARNNGRIVVEA